MKNTLLILQHEYITRVTKKSFIVMTLLGPILIGMFYGIIALISYYQLTDSKEREIAIHDPFHTLNKNIISSSGYHFSFVTDTTIAKNDLEAETTDALLDIRDEKGDNIYLIAKKSLSIGDKQVLKEILTTQFFNNELTKKGLSKEIIDSLRPKIKLTDQLLSGESSLTEIRAGIGFASAFVIYLFIFIYGVMIMRGVTDEKNNRIVEIIISAVKPFELMMGKILGVALVGLTQFMAWIVLSGLLVSVLTLAVGAEHVNQENMQVAQDQLKQMKGTGELSSILYQLESLNFVKILTGFILFFFGGFLLYSSMFAAIGSAVDSDTETQQFMFPVSMPLILGFVIAQIAVMKDPNSNLAIWCSMIPFTSPVVMMVRLPFDVSWMELLGSALILFSSFIVIVWLASKIYRIGILSYGQKASYKQLFKWLITKG